MEQQVLLEDLGLVKLNRPHPLLVRLICLHYLLHFLTHSVFPGNLGKTIFYQLSGK